ncbi:MAG TPA: endonuclease III [Coriobacteriia bacterium]|nr:endonuclease III [Coriobacteriia bacterium]
MPPKSRIAAPTTCCNEEQLARCVELTGRLEARYKAPKPALDFSDPFQLLVAVILSAQTTDDGVNRVTPILFKRFPDAHALASADVLEVEEIIRPTGFYHQKTKSIIATAQALVAEHDGEVPHTMDELVALRGVARKTANIVLGAGFGIVEGIAVDTHVFRLAHRLGLSEAKDPDKVEGDLCACFAEEHWYRVNYDLISHGRAVCTAKKPACGACFLNDICPSAFQVPGWREEA